MPEFIVVARAASALYFPERGYFRVNEYPSPLGPLSVLFQTRRTRVQGLKELVSRGLWAEVRGQAPGLRDALEVFPQIAQLFCPVLSVIANAPTEDLVPELAYDCSPDDLERDFFQQFLIDERLLPFTRPKFPSNLARHLLEMLGHHIESGRLHRAMTHYHIALQHWTPGSEIMALGHLYMGMEAMTPIALRHHLSEERISRDALTTRWGIDARQLDAEVRKRLLFQGDDTTYSRARAASDGFEHGYLPFQTVREHAMATKMATAQFLRAAIFRHLGLTAGEQTELVSPPYDTPPQLRVDKYVFGKLQGRVESLAGEDQTYPILRWSSKPSEVVHLSDGTERLGFTESVTPLLGPGVTFQVKAVEVWGGPGVRPKAQAQEPGGQ